MSKEVGLFANNPLANSDKFQELQEINDKLGGSSFGTTRRISLRGSKFREIVNGEQMKVSKSDTMNVVIIDCAPVARTFYSGTYDPDDIKPPVCWSANTDAPDSDATEPQATRCADCPQNIKGSGQGNTRACRYSQRLAVAVEGDLDTVYQLQIAATSVFGDAKENEMPMQGYARFLKAHKTPAISVVTEMRFDEDADVPKLFFRAIRPLEEAEFDTVVAQLGSEDVTNAITFKVFETDHVVEADGEKEIPVDRAGRPMEDAEGNKLSIEERKAAANETVDKPKSKSKVTKLKPEADDDDAPIAEPVVVEKTSAPEPDEKKEDLAKLISGWDD